MKPGFMYNSHPLTQNFIIETTMNENHCMATSVQALYYEIM